MSRITGTWTMNTNGRLRSFTVHSVDAQGRLKAEMQNTAEVVGFWSDDARKLVFTRVIDPKDPSSHQTYVGYLHDDDPDAPGSTETVSGTVVYFGPAGHGGSSVATRRVFGWTMARERAEPQEGDGPMSFGNIRGWG